MHNIYAPTQLSLLQISEPVIEKETKIIVAFILEEFNLLNEGEISWEKATNEEMLKEIGQPEHRRGYFVIKRVPDSKRILQLTWFMERMLLLW